MIELKIIPLASWAIDSEVQKNVAQKNIKTKHLSLVKARLKSFFAAKTLQMLWALFTTSAFRYYNIN